MDKTQVCIVFERIEEEDGGVNIDLVAVFPEMVHNGIFSCYSYYEGQHSVCREEWVIDRTLIATEEQQGRMISRLASLGYKNIETISKEELLK